MRAAALGFSFRYPYGGMAYANPDAVTQIANGLSASTGANLGGYNEPNASEAPAPFDMG
jgi:hypothetical protein